MKVEKQSEHYITTLLVDRDSEFMLKEFIQFYEHNGIHWELTTPYTPKQNRVHKRKNKTIVGIARSMLKAKEFSKEY